MQSKEEVLILNGEVEGIENETMDLIEAHIGHYSLTLLHLLRKQG